MLNLSTLLQLICHVTPLANVATEFPRLKCDQVFYHFRLLPPQAVVGSRTRA